MHKTERTFCFVQFLGNFMTTVAKATDRRELILDTALQLFSERGYFNTSVHDIKNTANVSIGAIYHHFGNKEAIAKALLAKIESSMVDEINLIMETIPSAQDRCKAVLKYLFEATESSRDEMQYMLYAKHNEFIPDKGPVCTSRPFSLMKTIIIEGMQKGEIRKLTPEVVGVNIFGGAIRLICLRVDGVIDQPLPEYLDEFWECACYGIKA